MTKNSKTYSVIQGEPQLGKQIETLYTWDRDEIIEKLVELFESDAIEDLNQTINFEEIPATIGEWMDQQDLTSINQGLSQFLDDDYGTDKVTTYLTDWFEENLIEDLIYELETIEYR